MKGTIAVCMKEMAQHRFGLAVWKQALARAGFPESRLFVTSEDLPDAKIIDLFNALAEIAGRPVAAVMEAFGEHWSSDYAPRVYRAYYRTAKSARELLLNLDHVHVVMTRSSEGGSPPRFRYETISDKLLIMHYESNRGLVDLMPGLIRGVGKYFNENLTVTVKGNAVHIRFP